MLSLVFALACLLLVHCKENMECDSQTMRAVHIQNPEIMVIDTMPRATLRSEKDVLIQVKAAGVNRADVLQRKGGQL